MKRVASAILLVILLASMLCSAFKIMPAEAAGIIYIRADGSIDPPTAPISTLDNITYTFTDNIDDPIEVERSNIVMDGAGYTVQDTGGFPSKGISVFGRNNVTIKSMTINAFYESIRLWSCSNISISGNNITNNWSGIILSSSYGISISGNNITNNADGITLYSSSNSSISGNNITNSYDGITLSSSSGNSVSGNTIANNRYGIYLEYSPDISISGNNITNNGEGIRLYYSSHYNSISGNNITNNSDCGIWLYYSSNSSIYHNNFVENAQQVYADGPIFPNIWDDGYPSGGNYWSDYTVKYPGAEELGSSGIWDTPYVIDAYNQDNYPLINPWTTQLPKFSIGDWVQTTANLNVREGPGLNYTIISTMPTESLGQIAGGPVEADGYVWWNVDYIVGIEGWSAENWLEIANELSGCGRPLLVSPLQISRTIDTLTAGFIIKNSGDASITLNKLLVGGRFNWGTLPSGGYPDFPYESVTLAPDESYNYTGTLELTEVGNYQFFVAYYIETPSEQERRLLDPNNWNTCIDLAEGLADKDRSLSFEKWPAIVISSPLLLTPPSGPYYPGDLLVAQFSIKNIGSVPVTLSTLTVGGRDPDGLTVDLDWKLDLILYPAGEPNDEYAYIGIRWLPGKIGNYHFFCAYQAADESWNPCIDLGEGLTDADRVKDIYVESEYPLGGIVIPEADFPEGKGKVIPICVPAVIDGSNVIREENGWQTVKTLAKAGMNFDRGAFWAGLVASGAEVWDPMTNTYVPSPEGAALSLAAAFLKAGGGAMSVAQIGITIQRNSQWDYRAILQVSDPEAKAFYKIYAVQGMYSFVPGELPVNVEDAVSDGIADYFKLPVAKFSETYLETLYIDKAHKNEEYNGYLSLSKGNRIELTPKIYQGDALGFDLWKQNLIFFFTTCREVLRLEGQAFVDFEKCRASDAKSKLIQEALAPISLVPESAILLNGGSPCEFRIWDSQGRVTGLVNGEMREEIPSSIYLSETKTIIVYEPSEGLRYEVVGTEAGTYELHVTRTEAWNLTAFIASGMPISNQTIHQYTIDWNSLSLGEEGVTVQVDYEGDEVFEHTFASDSELTRFEYVAATTGHDLGITGITSSKSVVGEGYILPVNITLMNYGAYSETFNLTIYANATLIGTQTITLENASSIIVTYGWNTTGFAKGNYTISAYATPVPGETNLSDNTLYDGWVFVAMPGDVNGDGIVNIIDIVRVALAFGAVPANPNWDPNADINGDKVINIVDIAIVALHFGETG